MKPRTTKIVRFITFFLVFFTSAFKYETGVDWRVYSLVFSRQYSFIDIFDVGWNEFFSQLGFESGYVLLTSIVKSIGGDMQLVYFVAALINIIFLYKSLTYFSKYPIFCLLGYYCFVYFILDMSGIRQSIALNIALYGLKYACERKLIKHILYIYIAALFHQTAYFLLILYPLFYKKKLNLKVCLSLYTGSLIIVLLKIKWLQSFSLLLLPIIGLEGTFNEKLVNYVFSSNFDDASLNIIKIFFVFGIIIYVYLYRNIYMKTYLNKFSYLCLVIFGIVNNMMFELSEINSRISAYLIIFIVIVASNVIYNSKIYTNRIIINVLVVFYCFLYGSVYIMEKPATIAYYPYQNYILYKTLDIQSTGEKRLDQFAN